MEGIILQCKGLKKSFGRNEILKGIDLSISRGEMFGLLGPNGAGKTTLIRCLTRLIQPSSGQILFRGELLSDRHIQQSLGFLPENFLPPPNLTGAEFLGFLAAGMGLDRKSVPGRLEQVGLSGQEKKPARQYSRGMTQRLGLAAALLKRPELVILDEPTLGLDPVGQARMLDLLIELNRGGTTIFFSSHTLSQVEKICHRVGIISRGELRFSGPVAEFTGKHSCSSLEDAFIKEVS